MTSVLHLDDVCLHRGSHQILSHVTWSVTEGQHWVLLGPNGAGKTTISRIAAARLFLPQARWTCSASAWGVWT